MKLVKGEIKFRSLYRDENERGDAFKNEKKSEVLGSDCVRMRWLFQLGRYLWHQVGFYFRMCQNSGRYIMIGVTSEL